MQCIKCFVNNIIFVKKRFKFVKFGSKWNKENVNRKTKVAIIAYLRYVRLYVKIYFGYKNFILMIKFEGMKKSL